MLQYSQVTAYYGWEENKFIVMHENDRLYSEVNKNDLPNNI